MPHRNLSTYLREHFREDLSVAEIARALTISESRLREKAKTQLGKSPLEFLTELRMLHAMELLRTGKYRVQEVAKRVGIPSPDRFRRTFIRYFGFPPSRIAAHLATPPDRLLEEGIACVRFDRPIPINGSLERHLEMMAQGRFAHLNEAYARMYGYGHVGDILGLRFGEVVPFAHQNTIDRVRDFLRTGYRIEAVITDAAPAGGKPGPALISVSGVIRDGHLLEMWGVRRALPEDSENGG